MDVIFNCVHCDQELSVDAGGAGSEIECPTCGGKVTIPAPPEAPEGAVAATPAMAAIKTSAAAKEEHHFKVPVHERAVENLIVKAKPPLEVAAKEGITLRTKTIRHSECVEVGHDRFDEVVTSFLNKVGQDSIVSISPINYQHIDIGSQKVMTDYGVFIVYKG